MRLSQDFAAMAAVKPVITSVAVRKPNKHEFVRVRPGSVWRFETGCFVDKDTREVYTMTPELWPAMPGDVTPTALVVALSRSSPIPFLWPLVLPSSDGRPNRWHESGIDAARLAESQWLRSVADMSAGCYVPFVAATKLPEPEWPADLTMPDYLRLAFQGRLIRDLSHPCLQRLRGGNLMLDQFREIWLVDFEFTCQPGERPTPLCLVGREFRSGKLLRVWLDDSTNPPTCPIPTGPDVLFVAYYASAELGC